MDTTQVGRDPAKRRNAILEAVAFAAEELLLAEDWSDVAVDVVTRLGRAAEVSRAYVVQNRWLGDDLRGHWVAEWTDQGVLPLIDDPDVRDASWHEGGFGRWADEFTAGRAVIGLVDDLPSSEAATLRAHGVTSIAAFPVIANGQWVGSVGFDAPYARGWEPTELEALRTAARLLGAAFERRLRDEEAQETERRYQAFIERIPAATYTDLVTEGEAETRIGFMSPQIERILGYPPQVFLDDPDLWYELIHPDDWSRLQAVDAMNPSDPSPFDDEYRMKTAGGDWVWVHDTSTGVLGPDGNVRYFLGFLTDITARKEAENRLRDAEERLRILVDNMPAIAYREPPTLDGDEYDLVGGKWFVSPQVERILGYTADEMAAPGFWAALTHPEDFDAVAKESIRTARTGEDFRMEYRMFAQDGRVVWFHDETTLVRNDAGDPVEWQGIMVDITERRQAELERAESEHRYRSLVDNAPDGIMVRVADRFVFANPRAAEILGAGDPSSLIGRPIFEIAHADYHEVIRGRIAAQEEGGEVAPPMHQRFIRVDGALVDVEVGGIPIMWEGERASLVVFRDISEELAAKRQLLEAEATFRTIVERNPAVIYSQTFDPTGDTPSRTTYVSPRQKELLGYTAEEVMADPELWTRQIHPEDRARVLEADLESNRLQESLFSMEYRMVAKDGRVIWVQDQAELVRIRGRPPFWQGFLLDITERKAAQERLEQALEGEHEAADRLRSLDEMKNTFLQAVSHDLRTPLSAILGLAITLERGDRLKLSQEDARELASRIAGNARRLERLVTNLLDMDRLARGIAEPEIEPVDVGTVVRHVIEETGLIHLERLRIDLPELVMPVDPAKLERIVENLLANTARHTPPDATVWVTARLEDGGLLLLVDDDGPGVPPDAREAIFEPFQQGSDVPRHSPGVGVGLTLVRQFAELHGGRAWVEERHGGGASFRVWLPLRPPDAADAG